jgi:hypothetical protein
MKNNLTLSLKENKVGLSLIVVFLTIILLALTLFSCKKDNNWDCKAVYHFHVLNSNGNLDTLKCHWTMTEKDIPIDHMSYDQIHAVEQANTRSGYFLWYGELWYVESTEHCIPAYCPTKH